MLYALKSGTYKTEDRQITELTELLKSSSKMYKVDLKKVYTDPKSTGLYGVILTSQIVTSVTITTWTMM